MKTLVLGLMAFFCAAFALFGARMVLAEDSNPRAGLIKVAKEVTAILMQREGRFFCFGPFLQDSDPRFKAKIAESGELVLKVEVPDKGEGFDIFQTWRINAAEKDFPLQYLLYQEKTGGVTTRGITITIASGTVTATDFDKKEKVADPMKVYEDVMYLAMNILDSIKAFSELSSSSPLPLAFPCLAD